MSKDMVRQEEFGRDLGVVHEAVVTGRKVGAGKEFWSALAHGENLFREVVELVNARISSRIYTGAISEWQKFYQKIFNITVDLSQVRIPEPKQGFNWLVIMFQGLTSQKLFDKCKALFRAWKWTDKSLDKVLDQTKSARNPANGTYAVWVRDRGEADEELKNKSAHDLQRENIQGITLEERLLLELFYCWKTKKHLDISNWTLCSGSRYSGGDVPRVRWVVLVDGLDVGWYCPAYAADCLRAREVVS